MSSYERGIGETDEWYTPKYIFDHLGCRFDLDVAAPMAADCFVPANAALTRADNALLKPWNGFVWMNPPFGGRNGLVPWLHRFFAHGNGIALVPDRTSAPWWQMSAVQADVVLFIWGKPKFHRPDGSIGRQPGNGVTLFGVGDQACEALYTACASGLGLLAKPIGGNFPFAEEINWTCHD